MFKYEYVTVSAECDAWSAKFMGNIQSRDNYREIIDARAAEGWRYVGYMPIREGREGYLRELDLIFEKEV